MKMDRNFKRIIGLLLAAVFLFGAAGLPMRAARAETALATATVNTSKLNVRKTASTKGAVVTTISRGTAVNIYSVESNGWCRIDVPSEKKQGYVSGRYLLVDNAAGVYGLGITKARVNLRASASTGSKSAGLIQKGKGLIVLGIANGWCQVKVIESGKTGYMYLRYVNVVCKATAPSQPSKTLGTINATDVSLRSGAGTSTPRLGRLAKNTALEILGQTGDWYQVKVTSSGKTGYVFRLYVTLSSATPAPSATPTAAPTLGTGQVTGSRVNMRKGPSTKYASLGRLSSGTALIILAVSGDWYQVKVTSTGKTGYIYKTYVKITSQTASPTPTATAAATAIATQRPTASPSPTPPAAMTPSPSPTPAVTATPAATNAGN